MEIYTAVYCYVLIQRVLGYMCMYIPSTKQRYVSCLLYTTIVQLYLSYLCIRLDAKQEINPSCHCSFALAHACVACVMMPLRLHSLSSITCISACYVLTCILPGDTCPAALLQYWSDRQVRPMLQANQDIR